MAQSFGQFLVNDLLPSDLRTTQQVNKKDLYGRLYEFARRDPKEAAKRMDQLRELGHNIATTEGVSITLDDIEPMYAQRNAITRPVLARLKKERDPERRRKIILAAQDKMVRVAKKFPGSQGQLIRSGGKGSPPQLMRSFLAPMSARQISSDPHPWMIHHSFSEGLRPSEMYSSNVETRNNQIGSFLQITEPGDFAKILVNNMGDQLILSEDCGTQNGVQMSTDDPNIVDRYLARASGSFPRGTLVSPQVFSRLRKKRGTVLVRSPMTCEHNEGICQKCSGLDEHGKLHTLGTNVGIRSAQAITEPLTQFQLSAKHGVRQAGAVDKAKVQGLKGLRDFLEMPKSFTNKAILSPEGGKVEKIEAAPQGGHNVRVGGTAHYVPPHLDPVVRRGQRVAPGDALSDGVPLANEVVQYKGLGAGRKYMVDKLHDVYRSQGIDVDKRHLEILARTQLNHVQVNEDPHKRFFPGEVVNYTTLMKTLADDTRSMPTKQSVGRVLGRPYLHHAAGTTVTNDIAKDLTKGGVDSVHVAKSPPDVSFIVRPATRNPLLNPDWLARLGHRYLRDTVLEGAHFGQRSNIHGTHPIPAYVYGTEFGSGPKAKY